MVERIEVANRDFINQMTSLADVKKQPIAISAEHLDLTEEVTQRAIAYWTLGWNWQEIEAALTEADYQDKDVAKALEAAKKHASDILKNGPFSTLEAGQMVRLNSGEVGTVLDQRADSVITKLQEETLVPHPLIDVNATKKLTAAFALRREASKLLSEVEVAPVLPESPTTSTDAYTEIKASLDAHAYDPAVNHVCASLRSFDDSALPEHLQKMGKQLVASTVDHMATLSNLRSIVDALRLGATNTAALEQVLSRVGSWSAHSQAVSLMVDDWINIVGSARTKAALEMSPTLEKDLFTFYAQIMEKSEALSDEAKDKMVPELQDMLSTVEQHNTQNAGVELAAAVTARFRK